MPFFHSAPMLLFLVSQLRKSSYKKQNKRANVTCIGKLKIELKCEENDQSVRCGRR